jgi:hypothetical protein
MGLVKIEKKIKWKYKILEMLHRVLSVIITQTCCAR